MSRDPILQAAQAEFDSHEGAPAWELKPHEKVCPDCWIVKPCDC